GGVRRVLAFALAHPLVVAPGVGEVPDDGGGARRLLVAEPDGVRLLGAVAVVPGLDMVLVEVALADAGDEALPDPGAAARPERVRRAVPAVELAHDGDLFGVGRPDGEIGAGDAVDRELVRPEAAVEVEVAALVEEVDVVLGQQRHVVANRRPPVPAHWLDALAFALS